MTLIELLVVMAIFLIILSLTVFDYSNFKSTVSIQNLADDIALSVRKAQTYAMGSKTLLTGATAQGYGVHFAVKKESGSSSSNLIATEKRFVIYSDLKPNNGYDYPNGGNDGCSSPTTKNECLDSIGINSDAKIIGLYRGGTALSEGESIDVFFVRPNPDARFCYKASPNNQGCKENEGNFSYVTIRVASSKKDDSGNYLNTKDITIRSTGQINVK